jgi:hypothetical protein
MFDSLESCSSRRCNSHTSFDLQFELRENRAAQPTWPAAYDPLAARSAANWPAVCCLESTRDRFLVEQQCNDLQALRPRQHQQRARWT